MELKSLENTSFDTLFNASDQAFAEYEVRLNKAQLLRTLKRRGYDARLSFGAFDGDELVSFTCNGIGYYNGIPTAYDTGTGTLKAYRGKGLATEVFQMAVPHLKGAGIRQYLLEVLQHNAAAVSVYRKIGFEITREFNCFYQNNEDVKNDIEHIDIAVDIQRIHLEEYKQLPDFWDFEPSWQNSFDSIRRSPDDFIYLGAFMDGQLVGYGVFDPVTGDVTQIAVDKPHRRKGVGSLLLAEMLKVNTYPSIKVLNTELACDSITHFLEAKNINLTLKQFEMMKQI